MIGWLLSEFVSRNAFLIGCSELFLVSILRYIEMRVMCVLLRRSEEMSGYDKDSGFSARVRKGGAVGFMLAWYFFSFTISVSLAACMGCDGMGVQGWLCAVD